MMAGDPDPARDDIDYKLKGKYPAPPINRRNRRFWGFGKSVGAVNLQDGRTLWVHGEDELIDGRLIGISGGRLFFGGGMRSCLP
jgi:hypothetical protein